MDWLDDEGKNGGYVRLAVCSNSEECWFWCCIVGEDQKPIFIVDQDAAIPEPPGLEIRSTGLSNFLKKSNINQVDIVGLETDYCVKYSSIDAYNEGFRTKVLCCCVRGISVKTTETAFKEMKDMGISII